MNRVRVETSFEVDSARDLNEVFDALADALFSAEAATNQLEDADVASTDKTFTLAIVGVAETIDVAANAASSAIRSAIQAARIGESIAA